MASEVVSVEAVVVGVVTSVKGVVDVVVASEVVSVEAVEVLVVTPMSPSQLGSSPPLEAQAANKDFILYSKINTVYSVYIAMECGHRLLIHCRSEKELPLSSSGTTFESRQGRHGLQHRPLK